MLVLALVIQALVLQVALSSKILIHPWTTGFNSRLINMGKMADMLAEDGHDVTVLLSNKVVKKSIVKKASVLEYTVPDNVLGLEEMNFVEFPKLTLWNYNSMVKGFTSLTYDYCNALLGDKALMAKLRVKKFDLLIVEMFDECNRVLVSHLNTPAISYQNHGYPPYSSIAYPQLFGLNCVTFNSDNCVSDDMTFMEKFKNIAMYYMWNSWIPEGRKRFENLAKEFRLTLYQDVNLVFEKNVVLLNADHVLHEPWPSMPNVFMISGLFNEPPNLLPKDLEDFVQGSYPHGVIVLSFGTLISSFKKETAELFAKVFARLPQRVIMRYKGELENRGNNTLLSDWIPQSDLLSHPLIRIFVTHCGISGTFQAAYKGVPVVTVPLFADQSHNSHKLVKRRGMGLEVNFHTITEQRLTEVFSEVLKNPKYKLNAVETSRLIQAHPEPPKQRFLQLVNYTITTGGAKHLIHDIGVHMTWYQIYALDVIALVLAGSLAAVMAVLLYVYVFYRAVINAFYRKPTNEEKQKPD